MTPEEHAQAIRDLSATYGEAKAQRVYLTEFRQSKKAMLMRDALLNGIEAATHQEREAYSSPEYLELIKGLAQAIEKEETLRWELESHRLEIEIFRSREATARLTDNAHR